MKRSNFVETIRQWLILYRAHTVVLEAPMAMAGAALALGELADPRVAAWGLLGAVYHIAGYGMNSYVDWKKGYDKDDPNKQHHPLNTGSISPSTAKYNIYFLIAAFAIFALALSGFRPIGFLCLGVLLAGGLAYNYFGKITVFKFIPISIAHTMVFVFPYMIYDGEISTGFIALTIAYFTHHVFQIAISGEIKDIKQDEANFLKTMGADVVTQLNGDENFHPGYAIILVSVLLVIEVGAISAAGIALSKPGVWVVVLFLLTAWLTYDSYNLISYGPFIRDKKLSTMSRREIAGYLCIHSVTVTVIEFGILTAGMIIYFVAVSKFMWKDSILPQV